MRPKTYYPSSVAKLSDHELMSMIGASPKGVGFTDEAAKAYSEIVWKYEDYLFNLLYRYIYEESFLPGLNVNKETFVNSLVWNTLLMLKDTDIASKYDGSTKVITYLFGITRNTFHTKLALRTLTFDELQTLGYNRRKEYTKDVDDFEIDALRAGQKSYNYMVQQKFLKENFTAIKVQWIMTYYYYKKEGSSRVHVPVEVKEYFYQHGMTDDSMAQTISRFKRKYYQECKDMMIIRD